MKIQIISLNKIGFKNEAEYEYTYSPINEPKTFDAFDLNFINLQNESLWRNYNNNTKTIDCFKDFKTLKLAIKDVKKSKIIVCLPLNYTFCANYVNYNYNYAYKEKLKNMRVDCLEIIKGLIPDNVNFELKYEDSTTTCQEKLLNAHFYFSGCSPVYKQLTNNVGAGHPTTISVDNLIITTLNLFDSCNNIVPFLIGAGIVKQDSDMPEWVKQYQFYDDKKQNGIITEAKEIIQKQKAAIESASKSLEENMFYKKVLFESGKTLENTVIKMMGKMLQCDVSGFVDEKDEDFRIDLSDITFIGEVKGIGSNVKRENVSQLDHHCQKRLDEFDDDNRTTKVKGLLIINYQRTKPVCEREKVNQQHISLAVRNGSLIITSDVFLQLFEKYLLGEISTDKVKQILSVKTGLLQVSDFE